MDCRVSVSYRSNRIATLKEVWEAFADAEEQQWAGLSSTSEPDVMTTLRDQLVRVNQLVLRNASFLAPDEQDLAQRFVFHLLEVNTLLRAGTAAPMEREWWAITGSLPAAS